MGKEQLRDLHEKIEKTMTNIQEGDMSYTEAGEYFYDYLGDSTLNALEEVINETNN